MTPGGGGGGEGGCCVAVLCRTNVGILVEALKVTVDRSAAGKQPLTVLMTNKDGFERDTKKLLDYIKLVHGQSCKVTYKKKTFTSIGELTEYADSHGDDTTLSNI